MEVVDVAALPVWVSYTAAAVTLGVIGLVVYAILRKASKLGTMWQVFPVVLVSLYPILHNKSAALYFDNVLEAQRTNEGLPKMIDAEARLDRVSMPSGEIGYDYTLFGNAAAVANEDNIDQIIPTVCPSISKLLLSGTPEMFRLTFRKDGSSKKLVVEITQEDCY